MGLFREAAQEAWIDERQRRLLDAENLFQRVWLMVPDEVFVAGKGGYSYKVDGITLRVRNANTSLITWEALLADGTWRKVENLADLGQLLELGEIT